MKELSEPLRELERKRLADAKQADREVEAKRGPRPLEGYAGGHTTWTGEQEDSPEDASPGPDDEEPPPVSTAAVALEDPDARVYAIANPQSGRGWEPGRIDRLTRRRPGE